MRKYIVFFCALLALAIEVGCGVGQTQVTGTQSVPTKAVVAVQVSPATATIASSQSVQFTALVKNTSQVAVTWSATGGAVSTTGLYQAPTVSSNTGITVTATSVADPTKSETASVTITPAQSAPAAPPTSTSTKPTTPAIKESFFGADFNGFGTWPPTDGQSQVATLGAIHLWDDGVKWGQINTSAGVYNWATLDNWISKAQAQHLDVLYTIGDTPEFAGSIPPLPTHCLTPTSYSCSAPKDVKTDGTGTDANFSAFITALVTRYKGQIAYYELWNEADCTCYFAGTQAQLVRMGKDAAAIIRSHDPAARILSPSAHGGTMASWFQGYIQAGGAPNFDIVDVHMRGAGPLNTTPESFLTVYADVEAQLTANKLTKLPVWDGEHGIKIGELTDPDELAGYVAREIALRAGVGLQRQYVYTWDDHPPIGLQGNESGTAWDVVAGWLIGHSISPCIASGTVYTCAVDNGQIVWDTKQSCSKGKCTTSNYTYPTTYAWQTDLTGKKTALSAKTVPIGYKLIFLTAK